MINTLWEECVKELAYVLPENEIDTWIRPLQAAQEENGSLRLFAPNQFVLNWIKNNCLGKIRNTLIRLRSEDTALKLEVGSSSLQETEGNQPLTASLPQPGPVVPTRLIPDYCFDFFVDGKSNEMASAAAKNVAERPGKSFNPLFLYGGVGLGKTHLMHAIGNKILQLNPRAKVTYLHAERFVAEMVVAIRLGKINHFKEAYRSVDVLLIDDIQMFAGKKQTQEEFFHTFNSLHEKQQQIVLTSDRYPKDIEGLEERLKSRFGWGLAQGIEPPELETRVAILEKKAEQLNHPIPEDVAFFIAKNLRSNVRELEGALRRVIANAQFSGGKITLAFAKNALTDMLASHQRQITIENIQKTVADFYRVRISDLTSPQRSRYIVRPRQIAMALSKELTSHSLPEIGREFGGRDHTTVLHACRKVVELKKQDEKIEKDYSLLLRSMQQ